MSGQDAQEMVKELYVKRHILLVLSVLSLLACLAGASAQQLCWDAKAFMDVKEVRPGMTGYGLTVFQGIKIERFNFTVIAVANNMDLATEMIMVKLTNGKSVEKHWNIVAGMSGSPMYIDGRLIGALAYGWPFAKEPICGISPIREMLESYEPGAAVDPHLHGTLKPRDGAIALRGRTITSIQLAANPAEAASAQKKAGSATMVLQPVATPLLVNGMSAPQLALFQKTMEPLNFEVIPGIAAGRVDKSLLAGPVELQPGASLATGFLDGDLQAIATGTVTYRKGNIVLAYGHPLEGFGNVRFPMFTSYVYDVFGSRQRSFKMCAPIERVGALTRDGMHAVGGIIGATPRMIPIDISLHNTATGYQRKFHIDVAVLRPFTTRWIEAGPFLRCAMDLGFSSQFQAQKDWGIFDIRAAFETDKYGVIRQHAVSTPLVGGADSDLPFAEQYLLSDVLLNNPYETVVIKHLRVELDFTPYLPGAAGRIEQVIPDRLAARPGSTVNLTVKIRRYDQQLVTRQLAVKIPEHYSGSMIALGVFGGAEIGLSRQLMTALPTRAEGVRGLIRLLSGELTERSLVVASFQPTPSYSMGGCQLCNLPAPLSELLPMTEFGAAFPLATAARLDFASGSALPNAPYPSLRPTVETLTQQDSLLISGGQLLNIAIDNGIDQPGSGSIGYSMPGSAPPVQPLLTAGAPPRGVALDLFDFCQSALQYSPAQRLQTAQFFAAMHMPLTGTTAEPFAVPELRTPGEDAAPLPLSYTSALWSATPGAPAPSSDTKTADPKTTAAPPGPPATAKTELSVKRNLLSLAEAKDFARGEHFGTAVTAHGCLTLTPAVRCLYRQHDCLPWKVAVSGEHVYLAGWGSNHVVALHDGKMAFLPATAAAHSISALTVDGNGNILMATWPDQTVRLLSPDGALLAHWTLPVANIWDLAVTSSGKRYAACAGGMVYGLGDDAKTPLHLACSVPDQHIVALTTDVHGNLYLASSPRGRIYRLSAEGKLCAIYEATGKTLTAVTSLAVDSDGNVYAGLSPSCSVLRIAPDGVVKQLMTGAGKDNKHVLALALLGDDLYAATGMAGGIYRISTPAGADPDVTAIYAREDTRTTDAGERPGPESLAVTALATDAHGALYAATAFPAQLLKLEARSEGTYVSPILRVPAVAKWGAARVIAKNGVAQKDAALDTPSAQLKVTDGNALPHGISVDTRSGSTGVADATWGRWLPIAAGEGQVASAQATYLQFRLHLSAAQGRLPLVEELRLPYHPAGQAPAVKFTELKSGALLSGKKELKWETAGADNDALVTTAFLSADGGTTWQPVYPAVSAAPGSKPTAAVLPPAHQSGQSDSSDTSDSTKPPPPLTKPPAQKSSPEITGKSLTWDTTTTPDGPYLLKIVTSNKYAAPDDPKSGEAVIAITVDNTPPTVAVADKVTGMQQVSRLQLVDALSPIVGGAYRLDDGPWIALVPEDGVFSSTRETVLLLPPDGHFNLTPGEHKLTLQARRRRRK